APQRPRPRRPRPPRRPACLLRASAVAFALILVAAGCGETRWTRGPDRRPESHALDVHVLSDTGRGTPWRVAPPRVRVSLARVTPASGATPSPPLPSPEPDSAPPAAAPPAAGVEERLRPPILKHPATLRLLPGARGAGTVELDV